MIIYIELYFKTYESDEIEAIIDQLHYAAVEKNYNFDVLKNFGETGEIFIEIAGNNVERFYKDRLSEIVIHDSDLQGFLIYEQADFLLVNMVDYKDICVGTKRIESSERRMVNRYFIRLCHLPTGILIVCHERHDWFKNYEDKAKVILTSKIVAKLQYSLF